MCNYGLIGAGMMGQEHIRNIALIRRSRVAAIFEPDTQMRAAAAALAPGAVLVDSLEKMLKIDAVDCLLIASPNHLHARQLQQIAQTRPLPLLVEKPLYTDPADAALIDRLAESYAAPIWVAMEYRYMPPIARLVAEAEAATGGVRMLSIREHRFPFLPKVGDWNRFNRNSGGTLVEKCCHFFDLMRLILADEPVRVMASGGQAVNHLDESYGGETPDIWDNAYVIVDFARGARAMLELCMFAEGSRFQEEISAVGPAGKIEAHVPGPGRFWPANEPVPLPRLTLSPRTSKTRRVIELPVDPDLLRAGDHNGATFYQHQRFQEVVRGHAAPEVTLQDGARAVAMGMAAQRSATTGLAVTL
ncbi:MAG: Gfo/Idh/MocA family oxidoreductase [Rhodobacter sp.]|nr:Gfo/Idh/MocA family oxidoreductase [Rhodobacter sp.]